MHDVKAALATLLLSSFTLSGQATESELVVCKEAFEHFGLTYEKSYKSSEEEDTRLSIFCKNFNFIQTSNARKLGYTLGVTEFTDFDPKEFADTYGLSVGVQDSPLSQLSQLWGAVPELELFAYPADPKGTPVSLDWRSRGAVTSVKNQGHCGSCWAYAAAGAIEGAWKLAGGQLQSISEQQFVDCATDGGNAGCSGGFVSMTFLYARDNDVCSANSYVYIGRESGTCKVKNCDVAIPAGGVMGYRTVPSNNEQALLNAVSHQPIAVSIDGQARLFQLYVGGIISRDCGNSMNHAVLLIGYGREGGIDYWLIKNSWGRTWGEHGYARVIRGVRGAGECGILTSSSYPVIDYTKIPSGNYFNIAGGSIAIIASAFVGLCLLGYCIRYFFRRPGLHGFGYCSELPLLHLPREVQWGISRNFVGVNHEEVKLNVIDSKAVTAEFVGTFLLVLFGCGTACSNGWFNTQTHLIVSFAFGMTVLVLSYSLGHHSCGQFNVAVTFAFVMSGHVPVAQGFVNAIAQFFASLIAASVLCIIFPCDMDLTRNLATNMIRPDHADPGRAIVAEAFGTLLLCTAMFETVINSKTNCGKNACIALGFATFVAHILLLPIDGCSINPMRSVGPAIISKLRGCENLLDGGLHDLWIMWVGPLIGAVLAERYRSF